MLGRPKVDSFAGAAQVLWVKLATLQRIGSKLIASVAAQVPPHPLQPLLLALQHHHDKVAGGEVQVSVEHERSELRVLLLGMESAFPIRCRNAPKEPAKRKSVVPRMRSTMPVFIEGDDAHARSAAHKGQKTQRNNAT